MGKKEKIILKLDLEPFPKVTKYEFFIHFYDIVSIGRTEQLIQKQ